MNLDLNNSQAGVWGSLELTFPSRFANPLKTILIRTEGKKLGKLKCMELLQLIKEHCETLPNCLVMFFMHCLNLGLERPSA